MHASGSACSSPAHNLKDAINAAGKHCGPLTASLENQDEGHDQDFRMLGVGTDGGLLLRSIHRILQVPTTTACSDRS